MGLGLGLKFKLGLGLGLGLGVGLGLGLGLECCVAWRRDSLLPWLPGVRGFGPSG